MTNIRFLWGTFPFYSVVFVDVTKLNIFVSLHVSCIFYGENMFIFARCDSKHVNKIIIIYWKMNHERENDWFQMPPNLLSGIENPYISKKENFDWNEIDFNIGLSIKMCVYFGWDYNKLIIIDIRQANSLHSNGESEKRNT